MTWCVFAETFPNTFLGDRSAMELGSWSLWFSNCGVYEKHLGGCFLLKHDCGPAPRVPGSVDLGWGPPVCTSDKCPGDAGAACLSR